MAFTCPVCHAVSYHPMDEVERYCGRCHQFYDEDGLALLPLASGDVITGMRHALQTASVREALFRKTQPCPVCGSMQVQLLEFTHDDGQLGKVAWKCRACKHEWSWRI